MRIQLHKIPLGGMTRDVGVKIGSMVGEVERQMLLKRVILDESLILGENHYYYHQTSYERHPSKHAWE